MARGHKRLARLASEGNGGSSALGPGCIRGIDVAPKEGNRDLPALSRTPVHALRKKGIKLHQHHTNTFVRGSEVREFRRVSRNLGGGGRRSRAPPTHSSLASAVYFSNACLLGYGRRPRSAQTHPRNFGLSMAVFQRTRRRQKPD